MVICMNEYLRNGIEILRVLKENNYEAYFVGGFVRDYVLKRTSNDIDITTSATPKEVINLFEHVKETGLKFGGVTVIMNDYKFEVTTFRLEGKYENHRHPSDVRFSDTLLDDLKRRDFTMNQLVMDEQLEVIDHYNGLEDIKNHLIRTINHPIDRFNEDSLSMLIAFRFVSKLGFDIEKNTLEAIMKSKELIHHISIERIMNELEQIINGDFQKKAIRLMNESKMSETLGLLEGFQKIEQMNEFIYPVEAFIICEINGADLSKFSFSNAKKELIEKVAFLHEITKEDTFDRLMMFSYKLDTCLLVNKINRVLGYHDQEQELLEMYNTMSVMDVCDLAFKGQDILALTTLQNKRLIGLVIDDILEEVILRNMPNEYEIIKEFALTRIKEIQLKLGE